MGSALIYVVVVALVAAVIYLGAALLFGRGEELAPMGPGATPTRLPARDLDGDDVRELRFQQALRGYRMSEVDWAIGRLADEVDDLRARLAQAEARTAGTTPGPTAPSSSTASPTTSGTSSGGDASSDPTTDPRGIPPSRTDRTGTDPRRTDPRASEVRHGRR